MPLFYCLKNVLKEYRAEEDGMVFCYIAGLQNEDDAVQMIKNMRKENGVR